MNYEIIKSKDKKILYNLLQFTLYDGSQYINNIVNDEGVFDYKWFENYFTDDRRDAYIVKYEGKIAGLVFVNENRKIHETGKTIAEFLILPPYRRLHLGKQVAYDIFNKYKGLWEVEPMENNPIAYTFWKNIINEYTNGNYQVQKHGELDVFLFSSQN